MVVLRERKEGSAASTAVASSGSGGSGGVNLGVPAGVGYGGKTPQWTPSRMD